MPTEIVGHNLSGHANGTVFISDDFRLPHCPTCGRRYDLFVHNLDYQAGRKRRSDLLYTDDYVPIVTQRFKDFVQAHRYPGVHLLPFKAGLDRFHLVVDRIVPYDQNEPHLIMEGFCSTCERYNSVATRTPGRCYLGVTSVLGDGIYRTDLLFADGNNMHPIIIVAPETRQKMQEFGLKGILFDPAFARTKTQLM